MSDKRQIQFRIDRIGITVDSGFCLIGRCIGEPIGVGDQFTLFRQSSADGRSFISEKNVLLTIKKINCWPAFGVNRLDPPYVAELVFQGNLASDDQLRNSELWGVSNLPVPNEYTHESIDPAFKAKP